jgi:hypothetical protein
VGRNQIAAQGLQEVLGKVGNQITVLGNDLEKVKEKAKIVEQEQVEIKENVRTIEHEVQETTRIQNEVLNEVDETRGLVLDAYDYAASGKKDGEKAREVVDELSEEMGVMWKRQDKLEMRCHRILLK